MHKTATISPTASNKSVKTAGKAVGAKRMAVQPKLKIGVPNDKYEREADAMADKVVSMPAPRSLASGVQRKCADCPQEEAQTKLLANLITPLVQRISEPEEVLQEKPTQRQANPEEELQQKSIQRLGPDEEELQEKLIQRKEDGEAEAESSLESRLNSNRGGGSPLPEDTRGFMESRFGTDFGTVKVHTNAQAVQMNKELNSQAFAHGSDVYFNQGNYNPSSTSGKHLLAHELTHTVQQNIKRKDFLFKKVVSDIIQTGKGKAAKEIIGWVVKVGERHLIKKMPIYTEKQMTKLLNKGYNILVKDGRQVAKRTAKKIWGDDVIYHTGHIIRKTGKLGEPHFQPARSLVGRAGEKGWHIFYSSMAAAIFFSDQLEAKAIYIDKYPAKSFWNYLTVTQYVGEDHWLSSIDWINPLEILAIAGDIGLDVDRELAKELKYIVFNTTTPKGHKLTYEFYPDGRLNRVFVETAQGKTKIFSSDSYFTYLGKGQISKKINEFNWGSYVVTQARAYLVNNPYKYKETIISILPQDSVLNVIDIGVKRNFNKTTDEFKWWKVKIVSGKSRGKIGWIMKKFVQAN